MIARMQAINTALPKGREPVSDAELKKIVDNVITTTKRKNDGY